MFSCYFYVSLVIALICSGLPIFVAVKATSSMAIMHSSV